MEGPGIINGEANNDTVAGISTSDTSNSAFHFEMSNVRPHNNPYTQTEYNYPSPKELADHYINEESSNKIDVTEIENERNIGGPDNPKVTYTKKPAEDKNLEIKESGSLSGHGILIIQGDYVETKGYLNWNGLVIITGDDDGTNVEIKGTDQINGGLLVGGKTNELDKIALKDGAEINYDPTQLNHARDISDNSETHISSIQWSE